MCTLVYSSPTRVSVVLEPSLVEEFRPQGIRLVLSSSYFASWTCFVVCCPPSLFGCGCVVARLTVTSFFGRVLSDLNEKPRYIFF